MIATRGNRNRTAKHHGDDPGCVGSGSAVESHDRRGPVGVVGGARSVMVGVGMRRGSLVVGSTRSDFASVSVSVSGGDSSSFGLRATGPARATKRRRRVRRRRRERGCLVETRAVGAGE